MCVLNGQLKLYFVFKGNMDKISQLSNISSDLETSGTLRKQIKEKTFCEN